MNFRLPITIFDFELVSVKNTIKYTNQIRKSMRVRTSIDFIGEKFQEIKPN